MHGVLGVVHGGFVQSACRSCCTGRNPGLSRRYECTGSIRALRPQQLRFIRRHPARVSGPTSPGQRLPTDADSLSKNSKTLFAVVDHDFDSFNLNVGIGRGLTGEADRWVFKFIVGTHFWSAGPRPRSPRATGRCGPARFARRPMPPRPQAADAARTRYRNLVGPIARVAQSGLALRQATGRGQCLGRWRGVVHCVAGEPVAAWSRSGRRHGSTCVIRLSTRCRCRTRWRAITAMS